MINVIKIEELNELSTLKAEYINQATAPLDAMWLCGFVPMATHFGFYNNEELIGFCCVNSDGYLLQFYVNQRHYVHAADIFTSVISKIESPVGKVNGAFASTAESHYFSLCLDEQQEMQVNGFMYQQVKALTTPQDSYLTMAVATLDQLSEFVEFAKENIGAPEEWVSGYYANLISRQELFGHWNGSQLIAAGERRLFNEHQTNYADLGMVVATSERGKGLGAQVLRYLVALTNSQGLTAMCSTEKSNIASQKAITHAGFSSSHRIVQFDF